MSVVNRLWPWALCAVAGGYFFGLWGFLAGLALLLFGEWSTHAKDVAALDGANRIAAARRSDDAVALGKRLAEIDAQLKELSTPERLAASREIIEKFKAVMPGLRR